MMSDLKRNNVTEGMYFSWLAVIINLIGTLLFVGILILFIMGHQNNQNLKEFEIMEVPTQMRV